MRLPHLVDVVTAAEVAGAYGSVVLDWTAATTVTGVAAFVQPQSSTEQIADAERVTTRWRIYLGPGAPITATNRVVWLGDTYEVDGDVEKHQGPNGSEHHREALLRKTTGG